MVSFGGGASARRQRAERSGRTPAEGGAHPHIIARALVRLDSDGEAFLTAPERPIDRRVDDSVVRLTASGPVMIQRARGDAPRFVARLPAEGPGLALGGALKSAVTLVVDGRALLSEHLGDLETDKAQSAFEAAVEALHSMSGVTKTERIVAFDRHPDYRPAQFAETLPARRRVPVQRHRAHIAGVLDEREAARGARRRVRRDGRRRRRGDLGRPVFRRQPDGRLSARRTSSRCPPPGRRCGGPLSASGACRFWIRGSGRRSAPGPAACPPHALLAGA
ncbi:MAG: [NiFe] hydrogenase metallocenter assembly protein HypF [Hydrogenibacillus schlegelii]|uniref:[NiFe] hydrogenase metallocenter assembly protein HypF n=1 Tax=Hydrogenibacillus schlegelii TaxID=1484 RepID=A0A2T5G3L4_HYDSH|nr:hypothetical protein [Hydrogenibacillus schlegelii]PTQ50784.1 MAG: [NiFe] hydrogenase metallocenter assembly protein HypF [Hydrogenibacillus schlegelii]